MSSQRPFSIMTYLIKVLHSTGRTCSKTTGCRTTARKEEVDCVFTPLMLVAPTQSKWMDSVYQILNLYYHHHLVTAVYMHPNGN